MVGSPVFSSGFGLVILIGICLSPAATIAANQEDVARAEREFELREAARELFDRADKRAKDAVSESSAGKELREKVSAAFDECLAEGNALTQAGGDRKRSLDERRSLLVQGRRLLLSCPDLLSELSSGNADLIAKLRDDFIAEEIERLRGVVDDQYLALIETAVQDISRSRHDE